VSQSTQQLRELVREMGRQAEVIGALCKEFERRPQVDVLSMLKQRIAVLGAEWDKAETILSQ
jgi:hypothetical protein